MDDSTITCLVDKAANIQSAHPTTLPRGFSSFSLSLNRFAKEIQEHSLSLTKIRAGRLGLLSALFCAFLGSVKGWMVSEVDSVGPLQIFGIRSVGAVSFLLPLVIFRRCPLSFGWRTNVNLTLRSLAGNVAVAGYYFGFAYLPLAQASLVFYSTPVYTALIGWLCLGERCGLVQATSVALSVTGVVLVSSRAFADTDFQNEGFSQSMQGLIGCLVGAVAQSLAMVLLRRLSSVPVAVVSLWWAVLGVLSCGCAGLLTGSLVPWTCGPEAVLLVLIAAAGFLSELAMVAALHLEEAGPVAVALTTEILWAFILQVGLQKESLQLLTVCGAVLILLSMLLPATATALRRWRRSRIKTKLLAASGYEELRRNRTSVQVVEEERFPEFLG